MSRPGENVVAFYIKRGMCEQWIKEGKGAINWTRLPCRSFAANAVRLQFHALAYNLGNFLRTLATPESIKDWSLTSLKEKLIKIGAKAVSRICLDGGQLGGREPAKVFQEVAETPGVEVRAKRDKGHAPQKLPDRRPRAAHRCREFFSFRVEALG
jgi:Transposase DDE domain group 1